MIYHTYILRVCFELWIYQVAGLGANSQLGHSAKCSAGGVANCLHSYKHTIHTFCSLEKKSTLQLQLVVYKHAISSLLKRKNVQKMKSTPQLKAYHTLSSLEKKCGKIKSTLLLPAFTATWILLHCTLFKLWSLPLSLEQSPLCWKSALGPQSTPDPYKWLSLPANAG